MTWTVAQAAIAPAALGALAAAGCGALAGRASAALLGFALRPGRARRGWCEAGCALGFVPIPALRLGGWGLGSWGWGERCAAAVVVWWLVSLAVADLSARRLPNLLTLSGAAVFLAAAAVVGREPSALLGGLGFAGAYFVIHLVSPRWMGAGDVKLALGLGALCATARFSAVLHVAFLSSLLSGVFAAIALVRGNRGPPATVAHGASMCLAAYAVLLSAWA